MKSFSNTYIFVFSTIMVVIVAALLSTAAMVLQPLQEKNIEIQEKRNILSSIRIKSSAKDAEELYEKYITGSFVINTVGEEQEGVDAFEIEMGLQMRKTLDIASTDVVAADATAARAMGFNPDEVDHIRWAHESHIGTKDNTEILGDGVDAVKRVFERA